MAVSVNAKEEIAISGFTPWDNCTIEGSTITMGSGYKGGAVYLGKDMSQYEYVWIKFTNATGKPNFGITYDEWVKKESWGDVFAATTTVMDGSGIVGIKLDKETVMVKGNAETGGAGIGDVYAQHVQQITIQGQNDKASVTVEGIWFGSTAEFAADGGDVPVRPEAGGSLTMWEGSHVYPAGWTATDVVEARYFDVAAVGDEIYCTITDATEPNFVFKNVGDWSDFTELEAVKTVGDGYVSTKITSNDVLSNLKKNGLRIQGINFTLTKVELKVPVGTGITAVKAAQQDGVRYNLAGQKVNAGYKGVVIENGKKFVVK